MDEVKMDDAKKKEKKEKKPLGIRADEELTADWRAFLDEVKERLGISAQDAALRELLKLADIDKMRQRVPGRASDIDDFRTLLDQLLTKFLSSVDAAALAKTQAEESVKVELDTKTRTIAELQKKQDELQERIATLEKGLNEATTENLNLKQEVESLNKVIADKDAIIQSSEKNQAITDRLAKLLDRMEASAKVQEDNQEDK